VISIVIPTVDGREDVLERVLLAYHETTPEHEVITVHGRETCGIAWQEGSERATGDYLLLGADDLEPLPGWWQPLVEAVERGCCPCPVVLESDGRVQSAGTSGWEPIRTIGEDWTPVDWTTVPFVTRAQWSLVAPMLPTHYCTDTWVSYRLGRHGIKTVLRTGSRFRHHNALPGRGAGMDIHKRNQHDRMIFTEAVCASS
jgi:hypothetical protein